MAYLQCGPGYDKGYYGAGNTATDCYEYKHQEAGYLPGTQYIRPPHSHNNYSGGNGYCETDRVTEYHTQGPVPGSGYGHNNTAGYGSGYAGQGLVGTFLGGARSHRSQHTRRRRVRKQYPTGEYYSCSESGSDSSDDEGRRGRRFC